MKKILVIVFILLCSSFAGINHSAGVSSGKAVEWVEVDRISTTIEVDPMGSYYFHINNSEIKHITQEKIPVMDALKRAPNWLRSDLENNFEKMACVDIDIGDHAAPTAFDIDDDEDYDLVVGTAEGKLLVYENNNNVWIKKGFLNDSNGNPIDVGDYAVPTFFDLYNDGKTDLIVGSYDGRIRYYENTTDGFVYKGYLKDNNKNTIDVGSYSAPVFAKVYMHPNDPDGKDWNDLIIGAGDGKLYFYENTRNGTNPIWTKRDNVLNDIDVGDYSKPTLADMDGDEDEDLTVGASDGTLHYYERTGEMTNPSFTEETMYDNMETCAYAAPVLADMDKNKLMTDDCLYDIVVGRGDGHIHLYKNVGTSTTARWDVFPDAAESVSHHLQERNLSYLQEYVNLILDVENEYVDEIAFCIAHTSPDVLTDEDVYLDVFRKNAELIYEIDKDTTVYSIKNETTGKIENITKKTISYANLVEVGNYSTGDYYTTIRYNYSENGVLKNTTLPRDIYYWFVVHPKITDEIPTFINPETGRADENGVFWREYLFYHADENYPSNPNTDPNSDGIPDYYYPKDEKPPLLKDKISNVTVMYDNVPYTAPAGYDNYGHYFEDNPRNWNWSYDKGHAVEVVSNWAEKTLPLNEQESDDGERPIQPVRIAHHHNGNCGELQDLTVAAARTCMIPAAGVNLIGEDHVWSEFYCVNESRDYHWHQWDNYWSDSGSVIDDFSLYWRTGDGGWDRRGGSGISKWWGDDHITEVTEYYVSTADVTKVVVNDAEGNPVDGAKVVVSSYWLADNYIEGITGMTFRFVHYVPGAAYPSIWSYTDSDGTCEFRLVGNFTISVSSKIGSDEETNVYIGEKGETATRFDYGKLTRDSDNVIKWEMDDYGYTAGGDIRNRENTRFVGPYIDIDYADLEPGNYTLRYITDRTHAYNSWIGKPPEPDENDWSWSEYFGITWGVGVYDENFNEIISINDVGNNAHETKQFNMTSFSTVYIYCIGEWGNKIKFTLDDTVAKPALNIGGHQGANPNYKIELEYNVLYDEQDTNSVVGLGTSQTLKTGRVNSYINFFTCGKGNMVDYLKGQTFYSNLSVLKTNEKSNTLSFYIDNEGYIVFSNDKSVDTKKIINVTITLKRQQPWSPTTTVNISTNGFIQGDASSFVKITEIKIRVDDNDWITAWSGSQKNVAWNHSLNMTQYYLGKHMIYVKVIDADEHTSITAVEYTFACLPTAINIASQKENEMVEKTISVSGTASDINIIQKMWVKIGDGKWVNLEIIEEEGKWNWRNKTGKGLDTATVNDGEQKIYVKAFNGIMYTVASVEVVVDNTPPNVNILSLSDNDVISGNIIINGDASDVNGIKNIEIRVDEGNYSGVGIASLPYWDYSLDTTNLSEGKHTIYVSAFDGLHYQNISVNITVDNNKPPEIIYSPWNDNIAIKENSTQIFEVVNNVDPDGNISAIRWYLDGAEITACANQTSYKFVADYDSSGSYQIKVEVWDNFWDKEAKIRIWNLTVENVNRAPVISNFTPTDSTITMNEGESKTFSIINASDPDGTTPAITWYLNDEEKSSGSSYTFYSNYDSAGVYIVKAVVSDGEKSISRVWSLTVKDVNQAFTFDGFSPNQTEIEMKKGMAKTFSVNADDPEDSLTIKWYVNGENVGSGDSYTFIPTSYGTYVVSVILSDGEKIETHSWAVNVKKPEEAPGFEVLSFLIVLGILIILRKIKKKS